MGNRGTALSRFAARLSRDTRGSSLLMLAAGIIPIMAATAGGVDLTRAYMAQARLQQAVDAAALAGRKAMDGTDLATAQPAVAKFIAYNFPNALYDSAPVQTELHATSEGALVVTASTTVPTTLMGAFGVEQIPIEAEASSRRSGTNIDVVLVLDVTGSMAYDVNGGSGSPKKIDALKTATLNFLNALDSTRQQLAVSGLRVRVGIVPYSQTVNIGRHLRAENANFIAMTNHPAVSQLLLATSSTNGAYKDGSNKWKNATTGSWYDHNPALNVTRFVTDGGLPGSAHANAYAWKGCVEMRDTVTTITSTSNKATIPNGAWDIIDAAPGTVINGQAAPAWRPYLALPQWSSNAYGPPDSAQVANYANVEPWRSIRYKVRNITGSNWSYEAKADNPTAASTGAEVGPNNYCPAEAKTLANEALQTKAQLTSYVNALKPVGSTLHDVGMYWGLAMVSPAAPFVNPERFANRDVKRYIVFMTDGAMDPSETSYSAWGIDDREPRTKTGTGDTTQQHNKRFDMLCEAAKRQSVTISTVAFGTAVTTQLRDCASTPDQSYLASNASDLNDIFKQIAQNIGYLRLSQ